jgi:hypothetical protein
MASTDVVAQIALLLRFANAWTCGLPRVAIVLALVHIHAKPKICKIFAVGVHMSPADPVVMRLSVKTRGVKNMIHLEVVIFLRMVVMVVMVVMVFLRIRLMLIVVLFVSATIFTINVEAINVVVLSTATIQKFHVA